MGVAKIYRCGVRGGNVCTRVQRYKLSLTTTLIFASIFLEKLESRLGFLSEIYKFTRSQKHRQPFCCVFEYTERQGRFKGGGQGAAAPQ